MMQQYQEAKERHPGTLLLFHMGDFYELFHDDAELAARELQLTLTSRDKDRQVKMAGFPHDALDGYLRRLLAAGHRVAICEQVEEASQAVGLVRREVVRVVTPGTLTEDALLDPKRSNHLAAVVLHGMTAGVAWVELTTGNFHAADLPASRLVEELARLEIAECLWPEARPQDVLGPLKTALPQMGVTPRPDWQFDADTARQTLHRHFQIQTLQGFGFDDDDICLAAAGAVLLYLQETLKASLAHLRKLQLYRPGTVLFLDGVTRRSLELTKTLREGRREGSVLAAIDRTVTSMGARLLQDWLLAPLTEKPLLEKRQGAVAELKENHAFRRELRERLQPAHDLPRLATRASTGRASPRDLAAVAATLALLPAVKALITARKAPLLIELEGQLELCAELRSAIEGTLVENPPLSPRDGGLIREGCHAELDELRTINREGKNWIAGFQAQEIARTGINSLKVGFNKVFGYYIEITHTHSSKIPKEYERRQTLKNAERYVTPELKTYEEKVLRAEEKSKELEHELFLKLREQVAAETHRLHQTAEVLATLDVLAGFADLADAQNYCRPELCDEPLLEIAQGRHPVLEQWLPAGTFVPNDARLGADHGQIILITGPNMAGKSVYIRQAALIALLAQVGSFVPAASARIGLTDRIFTRVGSGDDLTRGQSTFMVEMSETANILNNATGRSLVILDEIGRGTSTYDGLSLAWAITEHLHDRIGCRTLFATHYHELTQLSETLPKLRNYNALVRDDRGEVVFLHQIVAGPADESYGIHVAQLAGIPRSVLERSRQVLDQLENQHVASIEAARTERRRGRAKGDGPRLFGEMGEP
jgi:DNA mismatch repair protein MutS